MSVKIQVNDRDHNPKVGYEVQVFWTDGFCSDKTDSNGVYDTKVSGGTIREVIIYGQKVLGARRCGSDDYITVTTTK